ncbi:hypothetical protein D3C85_757600 [compost metagenome]
MSQVISLPAAFHLLAHVAFSPSIVTYVFVAENSRSFEVAVTSIKELSLKRRAVSLTTENASGRISNKVFSEIS